MKEYMVFCGDNYYPDGGAYDFFESFDNEIAAKTACEVLTKDNHHDWAHYLSLVNGQIHRYREGKELL